MPELAMIDHAAGLGERPLCHMTLPIGGFCGIAAVVTVLVGCVHEHLRERTLCQFCVRILAQGRAVCVVCRHADGHCCEVSVLKEVALGTTRNDPEPSGAVRAYPERSGTETSR